MEQHAVGFMHKCCEMLTMLSFQSVCSKRRGIIADKLNLWVLDRFSAKQVLCFTQTELETFTTKKIKKCIQPNTTDSTADFRSVHEAASGEVTCPDPNLILFPQTGAFWAAAHVIRQKALTTNPSRKKGFTSPHSSHINVWRHGFYCDNTSSCKNWSDFRIYSGI